jgi:hypothetical protein
VEDGGETTGEDGEGAGGGQGRTGEDGKTIGKTGKTPRARALNILIGKTRRTLVFKEATPKGTIVAIKVCR